MARQSECVTRALTSVLGLVVAFVLMAAGAPAIDPPSSPTPEPPGPAAAPETMPESKLDEDVEAAPAVKKLLDAPYLSEPERRTIRVFHGVWAPTDVDGPSALAKVSLLVGNFDDEIYAFEGADPLDRAEAAQARGDADLALTLTTDRPEPRAQRIRAEALLALGRTDDALKATEPLLGALTTGKLKAADEIVEGVRGLMLRSRLAGADAGEYQAMNSVLALVRDRIDRLYWPAQLAEAKLLFDKDNMGDADQAALAALELNPRCAEAWALRGKFATRAFDLKAAEAIAVRLDTIAFPATSAYSGIVRARAAMRMRDAAGALKALEPLLKDYPRHREALALRASALAVSYDMTGAEQAAQEFEALSPGSPDALFEVGKALSDARQYDESADYLRRAAERAPKWSAPLVELGLVLNQAGQDIEARDRLRDAAGLDPFNVRAGNTLKMLESLLEFATIESEHFVVHYEVDKPGEPKPQANQVMAREMIPVLEKLHATVTGDGPGGIKHQPAGKTQIDLMPDHASFAVRIAGMPQIHTIAAATGPVIAMEAPRDGAGHQGPYDWARVVQHEYTHTVTLSRTKNRIPHWFTEAAAVYLELSPRDYTTVQLLTNVFAADQLFDFEKINLSFIRPEKPTDRSQAYAQGHWMYEFMITRWGNDAPLALMDLYAQGKTEAQAFPIALKVSREQFFEDFKVWASGQLIEWGMAPAEGEPSVRELLSAAARKDPAAPGAGEAADPNAEPPVEHPDDMKEITPELVATWLEQHPRHPDVLNLAVEQALKANGGKPDPGMIPLLERYAAARPVDPMPHRLLARLYLDGAGDGPDAAIPHLEYLDVREQYSPTFAAELARRYSARATATNNAADWDRAQAKAARATQIAPFDADYRELAATIAVRRRDFPTARRHLQALVEIEPNREVHKQRLQALDKLSGGQ